MLCVSYSSALDLILGEGFGANCSSAPPHSEELPSGDEFYVAGIQPLNSA